MKLFVKRYSFDNVVQTSAALCITLDEPAGENDPRTYDFSHIFLKIVITRLCPIFHQGSRRIWVPYVPSCLD